MVRNIHNAAADLRASIDAPEGTISICVFADSLGRHFRVRIQPDHHQWVGPIPSTFAGFRVVIENGITTRAVVDAVERDAAGPSLTNVPAI
jgi:hypothetical protein